MLIAKARAPRKPPSMVVRPTRARDEALARRMEASLTASYATGLTTFKRRINSDALAKAYLSKDYRKVMRTVPFDFLPADFAGAIAQLLRSTTAGAKRGTRDVPKGGPALRYDLHNPAITAYVQQRSGAMIQGVTDDFQAIVQGMMANRFARATTTEQMAAGMLEPDATVGAVLKGSLGLDRRSAGALAKYRETHSEADSDAYEGRLHVRRAKLIARTEVAAAINAGQQAVWDAAAKQGLIDADRARRVWVVDGDPCDVCEAMDGVSVAFNDSFLLPTGEEVFTAPAHPACRCQIQLDYAGDDFSDDGLSDET